MEQIPHIEAVAHQQRLVQTVMSAEVGDLFLGHIIGIQGVHVVAVGGIDRHKDKKRHADDHRDQQQEPLPNVS